MDTADARLYQRNGAGRADGALELAPALAMHVAQQQELAVLVLNGQRIIDANPAALAMFRLDRLDAIAGQALATLFAPALRCGQPGDVAEPPAYFPESSSRSERQFRLPDGSLLWVEVLHIRIKRKHRFFAFAVLQNISAGKQEQERHRYLAEHDFLTGLPNRVLFLDRLHQALGVALRNCTQVAVMFIDLDRFKGINDRFGHHVGDTVLKEVAARLTGCVRGVDTVSRQGGDEFVVILADIGGADQAGHVAATVMQAVAQPVAADGLAISLSVSIGISMYPSDGTDIDTLLRHADVAMYHAKQNGRNAFCFFNADMNARVIERVQLENSLRIALAGGQFELAYQPQIDVASGSTVGAEALLRWRHPQRGLLLPVEFLSVAEECGLMLPIGRWVLGQACSQARRWCDAGFPVTVAVNLSASQFNSMELLPMVDRALANASLAPQSLDLEITEQIIMDGGTQAMVTVRALRERGVGVAIDNFGAGCCRLGALRRLPLSRLKIDRTFIQDIESRPDDAAIIGAMIAMARSLKLQVLVQGVETQQQLHWLRLQGCDHYQGHYASAPQVSPDFTVRPG